MTNEAPVQNPGVVKKKIILIITVINVHGRI